MSSVAERIDLRTIFMREENDLPDDWRWVSMKVLDHQGKKPEDWRYTQYEGAVYSTKITRGPRKGRINTRKPDEGTFRVVVLDEHAFKAWLPIWEQRTGKCCVCKGNGQKWVGWNCETGDRFIDCPDCDATGLAPALREAARQSRQGNDGGGVNG